MQKFNSITKCFLIPYMFALWCIGMFKLVQSYCTMNFAIGYGKPKVIITKTFNLNKDYFMFFYYSMYTVYNIHNCV